MLNKVQGDVSFKFYQLLFPFFLIKKEEKIKAEYEISKKLRAILSPPFKSFVETIYYLIILLKHTFEWLSYMASK